MCLCPSTFCTFIRIVIFVCGFVSFIFLAVRILVGIGLLLSRCRILGGGGIAMCLLLRFFIFRGEVAGCFGCLTVSGRS